MMEQRFRRSRRLITTLTLLVIAAAWGITLLYARQQQENTRLEMEREIQQLAQSLAATSNLSLNMADQALRRLQEVAQEDGLKGFQPIGEQLSRPETSPPLNRAALIGRDGVMLANYQDGEKAPLLNVWERDYFQTFHQKPTDRLFITEPILGKVSKRWIVLFSRPLFRQGEFSGAVFVGFETAALKPLFTRKLRPGMVVTLLSPEGRIITRSLDDAQSSGQRVDLSALPPPGEVREFTSPLDKVRRLSTVVQVPEWGMRVYVGLDSETLTRMQHERLDWIYFPATLLCSLLLVALYLLRRTLDGLEQAQNHNRAELALNQAILGSISDGIMITDAQATILMVNDAFAVVNGYTASELLGKKPSLLRSARHDENFYREMWGALANTGRWSGRVWNRCRDGSEVCFWQTISAVPGPEGDTVRYISISRDITEQITKEQDLWRQANFDPLTGLANRQRFEDRLAQAERHEISFGVAYLDLDRFKQVNDTLGHAAGDELLRQLASRMSAMTRKEDTLARLGGDEFALIVPKISHREDAMAIAEKLIEAVSLPFELGDEQACVGLSVGFALYAMHGAEASSLLKAADQALYRAKAQGRGCCCFPDRCSR